MASGQSLFAAAAKDVVGLDQKRAAIAVETARVADPKAPTERDEATTAESRDEHLAQLRTIDALYAQHQVRLQERQQLEKEKQEANRAAQGPSTSSK